MVPSLNVNVPDSVGGQGLIKGEQIVVYINEVLSDIKDDRENVGIIMDNFINMVMNEGDHSSSSKEALVNLMKLKADLSDKKTKIIELALKSCGSPRNISISQENNINTRKGALLKAILNEEENNDKPK